jgi:hypothetical protein
VDRREVRSFATFLPAVTCLRCGGAVTFFVALFVAGSAVAVLSLLVDRVPIAR